MSVHCIQMTEWDSKEETGLFLKDDSVRAMAERLTRAGIIEVLELSGRLRFKTTSYIGRIKLGDIRLTVNPKLPGVDFLNLFRYAYGLRRLKLFTRTEYGTQFHSLQELIICQLAAETEELLNRGLHRRYIQVKEPLASPRGRIDFQVLAVCPQNGQATLPCIHYPRMENCLQNRVLLAGLLLAIRLTDNLALKSYLRRLTGMLQIAIEPVRLDLKVMQKVQRETDRLAFAYRSSFVLIEILLQSRGLSMDEAEEDLNLPGFLFDMNRFFQALLSRFLRENLPGYTVRDEYRLKGMITYRPGYNPKNRRVPQLRPDYMVFRDSIVVAILDAKYRDLWEHHLPREMLYQLIVYALSQEAGISTAILYPTVDAAAKEALLDINDPAFGRSRARLYLRPVNLLYLSELITGRSFREQKASQAYARQLATGELMKIG